MKYILKYYIPILLVIMACSGCSTFKKMGVNLGQGLKTSLQGFELDTTNLAAASRSATRAALEEALKDSVSIRLQRQLDPILDQLIDSLDIASDRLRGNITGPETSVWLEEQLDLLSKELVLAAAGLRTELLGEESILQTQTYIQKALLPELENFFSSLPNRLTTPENLENIGVLRQRLSVELDSLLAQSIKTASIEFDENFSPRIKAYVDDIKTVTGDTRKEVDQTITTTQRGIRGILGLLLGGIASLILLWATLRYYLSTRRYKDIIKVLTKQIDQIDSQEEYDKLVEKVRESMDVRGLNTYLVEILEEENLKDQPEWKDKDQQVLKLIAKYLKSKELKTEDESSEDVSSIYDEAKKMGLDDHLQSVMDRMA